MDRDNPRSPGPVRRCIDMAYSVRESCWKVHDPTSIGSLRESIPVQSALSFSLLLFIVFSISVSCVNVGHTLLRTRMVAKKEVTQS